MKALVFRCAVACGLLLLIYFALPVHARDSAPALTARVAGTLAALAALTIWIRSQALRQLDRPGAPVGGLLVGIVAGVLFFSLVDYAVALHVPGQFTGLDTRIDALYFALTTLLTIGFGDITAQGQFARAVLTVQMVFNAAVLVGAASLLARQVTQRAKTRR